MAADIFHLDLSAACSQHPVSVLVIGSSCGRRCESLFGLSACRCQQALAATGAEGATAETELLAAAMRKAGLWLATVAYITDAELVEVQPPAAHSAL